MSTWSCSFLLNAFVTRHQQSEPTGLRKWELSYCARPHLDNRPSLLTKPSYGTVYQHMEMFLIEVRNHG